MGQCEATTQTGERCRNIASSGSIYCHLHGGGGRSSGDGIDVSGGGGLGVLIAIVILVIWGCNKLQNLTLEDLGLSGGSSGRASSGFSSPAPAPQPAREAAASTPAEEPAEGQFDEPLEVADAVPELSEDERIAQNESAVAAFATAARLAEDVLARDGSFSDAGPDPLSELAASRGEPVTAIFTAEVSDSPSTVSVSAPTTPGGSWGLAVWSPSGCLLMSKHPLQGTYRSELEPGSAAWCAGDWARDDYDRRPWWGGDRMGAPRAVWTYQPADADPAEPYTPADEQELARMGDELAEAVASVAAGLADEMLERDGSYMGATPDTLNEIGADRGWPVPIFFQAEESTSPLAVSVDTPAEADGSWGLAVWSPGGCLLVAKDPAHGTFNARLSPQSTSRCSGAWARDDYGKDRGAAGDRPGVPPLQWNRAGGGDTAPTDDTSTDSPDDDTGPAGDAPDAEPDTDTPTDDTEPDTDTPDNDAEPGTDTPSDNDAEPDTDTPSDNDAEPITDTPSDNTAA